MSIHIHEIYCKKTQFKMFTFSFMTFKEISRLNSTDSKNQDRNLTSNIENNVQRHVVFNKFLVF